MDTPVSEGENKTKEIIQTKPIKVPQSQNITSTNSRKKPTITVPIQPPDRSVLPTVLPIPTVVPNVQPVLPTPSPPVIPIPSGISNHTVTQNINERPQRSNRGNWKNGPIKFQKVHNVFKRNYAQSKSYFSAKECQRINAVLKHNHTFDNPTYQQAQAREDWPRWKAAIDEEMQQMQDEDVFTFTNYSNLPDKANILGSMFVLQIKRNKKTGEIDKYKARLVALGNRQKSSSYREISSNTVQSNTVKLLLSIQAQYQAEAMVLDVKGAYLKSPIDKSLQENLVLKLPDGRLAVLNKYLYGLKQAGNQWQKNLTGFLKRHYFNSTSDPSLFIKRYRNSKEFLIVSIHVDDLYCISNNKLFLRKFYEDMKNEYKEVTMQTGNELQYLGLSITRNEIDGSISVCQPAYVDKILKESGFNITKGSKSPMAPIFHDINKPPPPPNPDTSQPIDKLYYMKLIGMLNYLAIYSRPDILYALSRASQKSQHPTKTDLDAVHRIYRYIFYTKEKCLIYICSTDKNMVCQVDASFNCYIDGKAHYGYLFSLGLHNAPFCLKSTKIKLVTLSSTESEYVALAFAVREGLFYIRLLQELGFYDNNCPLKFYEDNQGVINMLKADQLNHQTTKHITPKFHFIRDLFKQNIITIEKIHTSHNVADVLTKALPVHSFTTFAEKMLNWVYQHPY